MFGMIQPHPHQETTSSTPTSRKEDVSCAQDRPNILCNDSITQNEQDSGYGASFLSVSYEDISRKRETATEPGHEMTMVPELDRICDDSWTVLMEYSETDSMQMPDVDVDEEDFQCRLSPHNRSRSRPNNDSYNVGYSDFEDDDCSGSSRASSQPIYIPVNPREPGAILRPQHNLCKSHLGKTCCNSSISIPSTSQCPQSSSSFIRKSASSSLPSLSPAIQTLSWPVVRPILDWWHRRPSSRQSSSSSRFYCHADGESCALDIDLISGDDDIDDEVFEDDERSEIGRYSLRRNDSDAVQTSEDHQQPTPPSGVDNISSCWIDLNGNVLYELNQAQESYKMIGQMLKRLSEEFHPQVAAVKDPPPNRRYSRHTPLTSRHIRHLFCAG